MQPTHEQHEQRWTWRIKVSECLREDHGSCFRACFRHLSKRSTSKVRMREQRSVCRESDEGSETPMSIEDKPNENRSECEKTPANVAILLPFWQPPHTRVGTVRFTVLLPAAAARCVVHFKDPSNALSCKILVEIPVSPCAAKKCMHQSTLGCFRVAPGRTTRLTLSLRSRVSLLGSRANLVADSCSSDARCKVSGKGSASTGAWPLRVAESSTFDLSICWRRSQPSSSSAYLHRSLSTLRVHSEVIFHRIKPHR